MLGKLPFPELHPQPIAFTKSEHPELSLHIKQPGLLPCLTVTASNGDRYFREVG